MANSILPREAGFTIDAFRSQFDNAARQNLFYVMLNMPSSGMNLGKVPFLVRSTSVPGKSVEKKEIGWQGYKFAFGGTSTHDDWTCTFMVDAKANIYKAFVNWSNLVHDPKTNVHGLPSEYMKDQDMQLLALDGKSSILDIKLVGAWPSQIGQMELNYDNTDIATFQVTFSYIRHQYY